MGPSPGSIRVRFADHPWGPWSPSAVHLDPGDPAVVGDPFGPGGFIFHPGLRGQAAGHVRAQRPAPAARLLRSRAVQPVGALIDTGILYAPNIIDAYTRSDGAGGLDVFWNVSAWNPYLVALLRTTVRPGAAAQPAACPGSGRARGDGPAPRFRWCARAG